VEYAGTGNACYNITEVLEEVMGSLGLEGRDAGTVAPERQAVTLGPLFIRDRNLPIQERKCGMNFSVHHALECKVGSLVMFQHMRSIKSCATWYPRHWTLHQFVLNL
jgi:hypothetical protein